MRAGGTRARPAAQGKCGSIQGRTLDVKLSMFTGFDYYPSNRLGTAQCSVSTVLAALLSWCGAYASTYLNDYVFDNRCKPVNRCKLLLKLVTEGCCLLLVFWVSNL